MIDEKRLIESLWEQHKGVKANAECYTDAEEVADEICNIVSIIDEQPKVGEWIPCSEQEEPTEDGMYLVSGRWLRSGEKVVDSCEFFGEWKCVNNFIIEAWMELPPAYERRNEDD